MTSAGEMPGQKQQPTVNLCRFVKSLRHGLLAILKTFGFKQGCVLASTFFNMMLSATLIDAFEGKQGGLKLNYRTDGGLFNISRMKATTK